MSYKTLILIDNSSELTGLNQEIVKETARYIIENIGSDNKTAIAVTGEKAEYLTDFDDSLNTQLKTIDGIKFTDINAPGTDVLMEVILDWEKGDLAYRNIVYISARDIGSEGDYSSEELLFEVNDKEYPIYTIACVQNENVKAVKGLATLSRISGGVGISTEDALSDASVEKQLGDRLLDAMEIYRSTEEVQYEEAYGAGGGNNANAGTLSADDYAEGLSELANMGTDGNAGENALAEEGEFGEGDYTDGGFDETYGENFTDTNDVLNENVIYEYTESDDNALSIGQLSYVFIFAAISAIVLAVILAVRKRRDKYDDDRFMKAVSDRGRNDNEREYEPPFAGALALAASEQANNSDSTHTTILAKQEDKEDTGTRLLYQTKEGIEITLEDRADPTKYYRACVVDSIVIGRSEKMCDIAINYDDSVSLRHCELFSRDGSLYLRDLGSSNGTIVNRQKVYQEIKIESGDILRIGRLTFFIQICGGYK